MDANKGALMLNIIEPIEHSLHQNKIESLLRLLKIYQGFELSSKNQDKATFIVAEDETRGVYGGAVFFPQKVKELDEDLSQLLAILENRTIWCARLCLCTDQDDNFTTLDAIELRENFYRELYKVLGVLGNRKSTNCLPMKLCSKDYHNSLLYGNWAYFTERKPEELLSDYVYVLLALPDYHNKPRISPEEQTDNIRLDASVSANTDRPVQ